MATGFVDFLRKTLGWWSAGASTPPVEVVPFVHVPRETVSLVLYTAPNGVMLADWTGMAVSVKSSCNEHGYEALSFFVPMGVEDAFRFYQLTAGRHVEIHDGAGVVWEGRVEDRRIRPGGLEIGAFGYWRVFSDAPYTALWSVSKYADWLVPTADNVAEIKPELYEMDNNNRLWFGLRDGEVYGGSGEDDTAIWAWLAPHLGEELCKLVEFSYSLDMAQYWRLSLLSWDEDWANEVEEWYVESSGSPLSGSVAETLASEKAYVGFRVKYNHPMGDPYGMTGGQTGDEFAKLTSVVVKGTTSANLYADEIVEAVIDYVAGLSHSPLSTSKILVESPGVELVDELYEDVEAGEVLTRLAELGDSQTPPAIWEVGVGAGQRVFFRERGSQGREWFTDVLQIELGATLEALQNSVYGLYEDTNGRTLRTDVATDDPSVERYAVERRGVAEGTGTSLSRAEGRRDARLEERREVTPEAELSLEGIGLFDVHGAQEISLWRVRPGDTMTIRNLPPNLSTAVDKVRSFLILGTEYDWDNGVLKITPEIKPPGLVNQVVLSLSR